MKVRIQNFSAHLVQTNQSNQFEVIDSWFPFQRKILYDVYGNFQDQDSFRIYLYLCMHSFGKYRICSKSKEAINIELKYMTMPSGATKLSNYSKTVDNALSWLEQKHFIQRANTNKHNRYRTRILFAPDFNHSSQDFFPPYHNGYHSNPASMKNSNVGFIMVPKDTIKNDMLENTPAALQKWSDRRLKTLLLLYAYCRLDFFGGINPEIVDIDQHGALELSEGFCFDLKGSPTEITNAVLWLINQGLFKPVLCVFVDGLYYGDVGRCNIPKLKNIETKVILRPYRLVNKKVYSDTMVGKWGGMIL